MASGKPTGGERKPRTPKKGTQTAPTPVTALMAKARVLAGNAIDEPTAIQDITAEEEGWGRAGAVVAPYDPESLLNYVELCGHVAPNIAAYVQNIEGFGYQAVVTESWMDDLDCEETREIVRLALQIERWADAEEETLAESEAKKADAPGDPPKDGEEGEVEDEVTDDEVDAKIKEIKAQLQRDQFVFDSWFGQCVSEIQGMPANFVKLKRIVRSDYESHGWGCIEFVRDGYGRLKRLNYVPAYTVRPLVDEGEKVEVVEQDTVTPISESREIKVLRRFRRFVQRVGGNKVYFKSPGDPRVVSAATGKWYKDEAALIKAERKENQKEPPRPANELLWIAQHSARTPCPPPRWVGNRLAVLGTRAADEVNYFYFDNKSIPPGMLFVTGGTIPRATRERLESRIRQELHGTENFHRMLVIEANPKQGAHKPGEQGQLPQITYQSLADDKQSDALFVNYDLRSADRIGTSFRLPRLLRGETKDFNRATALAALRFAEQQVFQPERQDIDWVFNKSVLPEIGVKYLKMRSNSPPARSLEEIAELVSKVAPQGGLVPSETRQLVGDAINSPLEKIDESWTKQPMAMTLAGIMGNGGGEGGGGEEMNQELATRVEEIESRLAEALTAELRESGYDMQVEVSSRPALPPDTSGDEE